ncbi:putative kelch-like protein [Erwinia phage pEa_SNUABM_12]|uniref:Putative kelch-like protein n=1 Tax=Erwinia phage pEa_SNUABM_12 TaxID=2768773 RepID=A0A7L8ZMC7_9CAUD|nr:putative kelch-like protein [Erwinia phage pEa_SNUABM_12]QXO12245.1 hypothetical protein pEaSNUABM44_00584 [Erwinia phage pEa_SNUABM_44]
MLPFARIVEYGNVAPPKKKLNGDVEVLNPVPVPAARRNAGACSAQGKIYIFGGYTGTILKTMQVYDPSDNTFTNLTATPNGRYSTTLSYYNGFIYMYSGNRNVAGDNNNDFWKYEISTDTWTSLSTTGYGNGGSDAYLCTAGDYLYVVSGDGSNQLYRYNPNLDEWNQLTSVPVNISTNGGACSSDTHIFAMSGGVIYKYDISTDMWEMKASQNTVITSRLCYIDGYVYAYGTGTLMVYDVNADSWSSFNPSPSYNATQNCLVSMYKEDGTPSVYSLFGGGVTSSVYRFT